MIPDATELVEQLQSENAKQRELAAEYLGDLLEGSSLAAADHNTIAAALVRAALDERDVDARESQLNAIASSHELAFETVEPLTALMPSLDTEQLDYCLGILATTHDPAAEPTIKSYTKHPDDRIRTSAQEALAELPGRP